MLAPPIPYRPDVEQPEPDEAETIAQLTATLLEISRTTFADTGKALRSVHAKSHGLLQGELIVGETLAPELRQGLFAAPGRYPVVLRFSTNPGDLLDDSISVPRGLAIKVTGVAGEGLPGSAGVQDFVLVNGPAFAAPTARKFLSSLRLLAKTTDTPQGLKKVVSAALRGAERVVEAFGAESATIKGMGGHPNTHILGETFFSQAPLRYGDYIAKLSVAPATPSLRALTGAKVETAGHPDALRAAVTAFFAAEAGEWEMRVQLCRDLGTMPVEDASVAWPETASPWQTVARLVVPPQPGWSEARSAVVDDGYAFSPWNGLAAHRPLGAIMRARRTTYEASVAFRGSRGRCPIHQPQAGETLPP
jgi:hypothetical protein